jgi:ribulose-5-phosphate 4-epimerase/fuculose-1-phosphate aldolase
MHDQRTAIATWGCRLWQRGYAPGSSGNISVRLDDGSILVTPTNSCLGVLEPSRISHLAPDGTLLAGDAPSKEAFLHLAMYEERPRDRAIVHLHCTHAVGLSCLCHADPAATLPPMTAYQVMKVHPLPLIAYHRPGDRTLAQAIRAQARWHRAVLLANHGPVVAGRDLTDAVFAAEEVEEGARLFFLLQGHATRFLDAAAIADLNATFPS